MHILTKIFVVLVTLLAIFLVPLVVVSAQNQLAWKTRALESETDRDVARQQLNLARSSHQSQVASLTAEASDYAQRLAAKDAELTSQIAQLRSKEDALLNLRSKEETQSARVNTLLKSHQTSTELNSVLSEQASSLRDRALTSDMRVVEMEELLRDRESRLESAIANKRDLEEQYNRLKEEKNSAKSQVAAYVARFGALDDSDTADTDGLAPDRTLDATILDVRRLGDKTLVEIDAGERDGVKKGWVMTIGDNGIFIGRLRITQVDINRSTGEVTLEDPSRGLVETGQRAYALMGQN